MTELRQLASFVVGFRLEDAPPEVVKAAKYCVLDSVGSALGAAYSDEIPSVCSAIRKIAESSSDRQAWVWGQGFKMDMFQSLLLNGIMGHALEMDDVHTRSKSHIGAVVVETAWTVSEAEGKNGTEFLEAVIVGYEVMARVGMAMDVVSNRKRGWHTTGLIGTFGAAAAAGRLLKLTEEQMVSALGMAGTQSSGLWAFLEEGSTCKKLHPARAAVNGLTAAVLAGAGMTGPERILEAKDGGLYRAVSDSYDLSLLVKGLGKEFEILNIDKKPYPCCRTTHHAIDAALVLRRRANLDEITGILVETYEVGVLQCGFPEYPQSVVEAKFSIPYTVAAALVRGRVSLAEFKKEVLEDPQVRRLAGVTRVVSKPLFDKRYPSRWGSRLTITCKSGDVLVKQIDDMSGSRACPLTEEQEFVKFKALAAEVMDSRGGDRLAAQILEIEGMAQLPELGGFI